MLKIFSIILNLLRLVLYSKHTHWKILENVSFLKMFPLEKNVYSAFFEYHIPKISIKSNCSVVSFRISVALLIYCLES